MSSSTFKRKKEAFSLAELVLTMTIIGIFASYTIPVLYTNLQDAYFKIAFKRNYMIVHHAMMTVKRNHADSFINMYPSCNEIDDCEATSLINDLKPLLAYTKTCRKSQAISDGCWESPEYLNRLGFLASWEYDNGVIVLNNGAAVTLGYTRAACDGAPFSKTCGSIFIDVNGSNGPNMLGRDVYGVRVFSDGIKPVGTPGDNDNTCIRTGTGRGCAAKVLKGEDY